MPWHTLRDSELMRLHLLCAVLCCAVLCCAVLCCAVLCCSSVSLTKMGELRSRGPLLCSMLCLHAQLCSDNCRLAQHAYIGADLLSQDHIECLPPSALLMQPCTHATALIQGLHAARYRCSNFHCWVPCHARYVYSLHSPTTTSKICCSPNLYATYSH